MVRSTVDVGGERFSNSLVVRFGEVSGESCSQWVGLRLVDVGGERFSNS